MASLAPGSDPHATHPIEMPTALESHAKVRELILNKHTIIILIVPCTSIKVVPGNHNFKSSSDMEVYISPFK